ncbi:hypothetical protein EYR41_003008 [Orbilia oligospora]|uniref:Uncharacterized protein n=1 Tax=Orbilia oligospora TaxID=2813651 RepID=A0A8H2E7U8_ORBOL|nr:hypothetical protein EYR41_003008 [Orbilia oligospora]
MQNRLIIIIIIITIIIIIIIFNKILNLTTDRAILKKSSTCTTTAIRRGETGSSKAKLEYYASSQTKTGNLMNLFRNVVGPEHEPQLVTITTHDPLIHMTTTQIPAFQQISRQLTRDLPQIDRDRSAIATNTEKQTVKSTGATYYPEKSSVSGFEVPQRDNPTGEINMHPMPQLMLISLEVCYAKDTSFGACP